MINELVEDVLDRVHPVVERVTQLATGAVESAKEHPLEWIMGLVGMSLIYVAKLAIQTELRSKGINNVSAGQLLGTIEASAKQKRGKVLEVYSLARGGLPMEEDFRIN